MTLITRRLFAVSVICGGMALGVFLFDSAAGQRWGLVVALWAAYLTGRIVGWLRPEHGESPPSLAVDGLHGRRSARLVQRGEYIADDDLEDPGKPSTTGS